MIDDNKLVNYAAYTVALATNSVSDGVRDTYFSTVADDRDSRADVFNMVLASVLKGIDDGVLDIESAKLVVETEYTKSCLVETFGDYNKFFELINKAIEVKASAERVDNIDEFKHYIDIADALEDDFAISVYFSVLAKMCYNNKVLEDIDFSKKLINFVNAYPSTAPRFLFEAVSKIFL